jgi:predicted aspartyl protease
MKGSLLLLAAAALIVSGCGASSTTTAKAVIPTENPDGSLNVAIKVVRHGKQVIALVPVTINGKGPYTFALDTGASQSLVDSSVAKELDVKPTGDTHKVAGISSVTKVTSIAVKRWRVGKVQLPATTIVEENLPFGNADGGVQGLLGSDMLSQFDVVTIDYNHSVLRLHHRAVKSSR